MRTLKRPADSDCESSDKKKKRNTCNSSESEDYLECNTEEETSFIKKRKTPTQSVRGRGAKKTSGSERGKSKQRRKTTMANSMEQKIDQILQNQSSTMQKIDNIERYLKTTAAKTDKMETEMVQINTRVSALEEGKNVNESLRSEIEAAEKKMFVRANRELTLTSFNNELSGHSQIKAVGIRKIPSSNSNNLHLYSVSFANNDDRNKGLVESGKHLSDINIKVSKDVPLSFKSNFRALENMGMLLKKSTSNQDGAPTINTRVIFSPACRVILQSKDKQPGRSWETIEERGPDVQASRSAGPSSSKLTDINLKVLFHGRFEVDALQGFIENSTGQNLEGLGVTEVIPGNACTTVICAGSDQAKNLYERLNGQRIGTTSRNFSCMHIPLGM